MTITEKWPTVNGPGFQTLGLDACMAWLAQKSVLEVSRPLTNSMGLS